MKSISSIKNLPLFILCIALSLSSFNALSAPLPLTDSELDSISAGYVKLTMTSAATASGANALTITITDVNIESRNGRNGRKNNGRVRTVATGSATAEAIGDMVFTETGYILDTDEQLRSLRAVQTIQNSDGSSTVIRVRINRNGRVTVRTRERGPALAQNQTGPITESNTLTVRVVTRTPTRHNRRRNR